MDPGTDAREILDGSAVRLKHGWIGVVNRGQKDIIQAVSGQQDLLKACIKCTDNLASLILAQIHKL